MHMDENKRHNNAKAEQVYFIFDKVNPSIIEVYTYNRSKRSNTRTLLQSCQFSNTVIYRGVKSIEERIQGRNDHQD